MAWRAEVRESLRDELANQYNRFSIVMLCDTVCLSCVFSLVAEASLPDETPAVMINLYVLCMGVTIMLFTISLWYAVIAVRRLHEHTASILERKLFAFSEDLQRQWRNQLDANLPTGAQEVNLMNQAYEKWVEQYLRPVGGPSIHLMAVGVVMMFITAGLLTHNLYLIQYKSVTAGAIFWCTVFITSTTVIWMKYREDHWEKRKVGIYDNSWQDKSTLETGPFAKINRAAQDLFNEKAVAMGREERTESLYQREREERKFCPKTDSLHRSVESLREESNQRAKMRKNVLHLLTTAAEELDALPEELTVQLNKLLHEIDEADGKTAEYITKNEAADSSIRQTVTSGWESSRSFGSKEAFAPQPIDAQHKPVSLGPIRNKLGEFAITTLLRIRNMASEPLRLKSGIKLKEGRYIKRLKTADSGEKQFFQLYPCSEIPPRSEVVVACQNNGRWLLPTSGIAGDICYTDRGETWSFHIVFSNELLRKVRHCQVHASRIGREEGGGEGEDAGDEGKEEEDCDEGKREAEEWIISKEELDIKANNEVLVKINKGRRKRQDAAPAEVDDDHDGKKPPETCNGECDKDRNTPLPDGFEMVRNETGTSIISQSDVV